MPYQPLNLGPHVSPALRAVVRRVFDGFFQDFRDLVMVQGSQHGAKGSLQRPMAMLILTAADGAAQLLHPGEMKIGERFKSFLLDNLPWHLDKPDGMTPKQAVAFLWYDARCPLVHRFGLTKGKTKRITKYGKVHTVTDAGLTALEQSTQRPYSDPSIRRNATRTVFWVESFYWSLRQAIEHSLSTKVKADAIETWVKSGKWDDHDTPSSKKRRPPKP